MPIERKTYSLEVGGKTLTVELSSIAEQANASVIVRYGETIVLGTAVMSGSDKALGYMPLKVDYEERFYAAGKVMGSRYMRREGRPSEEAVLSGRLVDRTIRPLFNQRMRRDVQVVVTVLSFDEEQDPDFPGLVAASLALGISDIPWAGPVAAVRIASMNGKLEVNSSNSELRAGSDFVTFAAGPRDLINMIELSGNESQEEPIIKAYVEAQKEINKIIDFQESIIKEIGKPKAVVNLAVVDPELEAETKTFLAPKLETAIYPHLHPENRVHALDKVEMDYRIKNLKDELYAHLKEKFAEKEGLDLSPIEFLFEEIIDDTVHVNILEKGLRPDGRKMDEVRPLQAEVGLFRRMHGSSIFMRGNTQALAITTLAPPGQEQVIESMEMVGKRRFLLHYNFPSFSVGETGPFRGPGRREIGHGALASKAIEPLIPTSADFPYTIRVVSEILSSNGSSSMATVCATTLSLMDAGVPIKAPAAGIAMGLMSKGGAWKVLTDIQGPEDHYGDMDFKVAGTRNGITAIQLDVKIGGLTNEMISQTIVQAKAARMHILDFMQTIIEKPRPALSEFAPAVLRLQIDPSKIGMVIGPGGKVINGMIEKYGLAGIDIEEDGNVFVSSSDVKKAQAAVDEIKSITHEFTVGEIVEGKIVKMLEFGAIVDLGGGMDGMIHVSELKDGFVQNVTDVVKLGDFVRAKVVRAEDGRIGLSLKQMSGGGTESK